MGLGFLCDLSGGVLVPPYWDDGRPATPDDIVEQATVFAQRGQYLNATRLQRHLQKTGMTGHVERLRSAIAAVQRKQASDA